MGRGASIAIWTGAIIGSVVVFSLIAASFPRTPQPREAQATALAEDSNLALAKVSALGPGGELTRAFTLSTDMTSIQVDQLAAEIHGQVVQWRGPVSQVRNDGLELVVYFSETRSSVAFECWIANPTAQDIEYAARLRLGQTAECRGAIDRPATFGGLVLHPSALIRP